MKNLIPNAITSLNLVLGLLSIISTLQGDFYIAALYIVAAMIADGMDGRVARYFKVSSDFGRELDSLCDVVSFGVSPAILAYSYLLKDIYGIWGYLIASMFAVCGALRLARFNINTTTTKGHFMGLPIPAGGCLVATFVMLGVKPEDWLFAVMVALVAYLMVSTVKYPDFKGKGDKIHLIPVVITLAISCYILFISHQAYLFVPFFAYALFGILNTVFALLNNKSVEQ